MPSWNNNPFSSKIQFSSHSLKAFISLEQAKKLWTVLELHNTNN
jgi:hypothetical protein